MPRSKTVYSERLTIKITKLMQADLNNVATKHNEPVSAIVRQAVRNYLDGTDLTLGTRRTFDRRFQKRMAEMEQTVRDSLKEGLNQIATQVADAISRDQGKTEYLVRRTVNEALSGFMHELKAELARQEETRKNRRWL